MTMWSPAAQTAVISACSAAMPLENADRQAALELAERPLERRARRVGASASSRSPRRTRRGAAARRCDAWWIGGHDAAVGRVGLQARVHDAGGVAAVAHDDQRLEQVGAGDDADGLAVAR